MTPIPAGWKLVPIEPTKEMIAAGQDEHDNCIDSGYDSDADGNRYDYTLISPDAPARIYRAMLRAAPGSPAYVAPGDAQDDQRAQDGNRPDLDWIEGVRVTDTVGRGWCVRIDGTDIFEDVNRYGCKGRRSFQIAAGLTSKQEAERAAEEWLTSQLVGLVAPAAGDALDVLILTQALQELRQAFVIAVGDKSPFARIALEKADAALAAQQQGEA